jgi:hypothetical protein
LERVNPGAESSKYSAGWGMQKKILIPVDRNMDLDYSPLYAAIFLNEIKIYRSA